MKLNYLQTERHRIHFTAKPKKIAKTLVEFKLKDGGSVFIEAKTAEYTDEL